MRWEAWVLVIGLVVSIVMQVYYIDRRRPILGPVESFINCLEIGFYILLVVRLAGYAS